jgi:hypothetical protein
MAYFTSIILNITCISVLSLFLNSVFKIKLNYSFLISICFCALILYMGYLILPTLYLNYYIYGYLLIIFILPWKILLEAKISKENFILLIEFICLCFVISIFTWNRYYLDQDELDHWGRVIKYFHFISNEEFDDLYLYSYHKPFLPIFHFFNSFFSGYREDIMIFSNNLIIISSFYFIFYHHKISFLKRIFLFIIFYLSINNLTFGLVSIYADPIISLLYACLVFYIYRLKEQYEYTDFFIIITLASSLFLLHNSGVVFLIFAACFWFFLNLQSKFRFPFLIIMIINLFFVLYIFFFRLIDFSFFELNSLKFFLKNFLLTDIYFSDFGVSLNTILSYIKVDKFRFVEIDINVLFWLIFILLVFLTQYKKNSKIILFFLFQFFTYSLIIYAYKIHFTELSILVYGRYIGIYFLSLLLIAVFIISVENKKFNFASLSIIFLILFSITPNKTYGFLLPQKFFLKQIQNQNFLYQKQKINKLNLQMSSNYSFYVVEGSAISFTTKYHPTMPISLINYELYGAITDQWIVETVLYSDYLKGRYKVFNPNIIFYNLTKYEKKQINKINSYKNKIFLNFD